MRLLNSMLLTGSIAAFTGCADTSAGRHIMLMDGVYEIKPAETIENAWIVTVHGAKYVGFDANRQADRQALAVEVASKQCASPQIVSESVFERGKSLLGEVQRSYYITVRC